ncbi:MAG TPA: hypothetical protein VK963_00845 [Candidatus Saccharimonadales bacterium]|nr:hypothetical protein [Candidatus Saccharimonadales bacterium]
MIQRTALFVLVLALAPACGQEGGTLTEAAGQAASSSTSANQDPAITPTTVISDEALYSIRLPAGWSKVDEGTWRNAQVVNYADGQGRYFDVVIWPRDADYGAFVADQTWGLAFNPFQDGYQVVEQSPVCDPDDESGFCSAGDGQLQIYALLADRQADPFVDGHDYQFEFGSTEAETGVDTDVFKQIIGAFTIRRQ